jgi:hypothetical protein
MAFLPDQQQDQTQQSQTQNQIPAVPQIPTLQGASGPSAGQGSGTGATNTAASPGAAPTSPWQNISAYLQANAGQAGNVANTIAGNLQSQYNTANQGIQQANQNFGQQIESARVPLNQQVAQQAATNPGQFAKDPNNVAAFQQMFNAQYSGPQDFSHSQDYSNLQGQVQKAQGQAALVNQGTPGLMTLLQEAESQGGRNPTQGITALDSLLLQEDPNNFATLSSAAQPFAGLTNYLGQTQQGLDTAAQNAAKEAAATKSQIQNQFIGPGGVAPTMQAALNKQLQTASQQAKGYNTQISDIIGKLNSGQALSPQESALVDPAGTLQSLNPFGTSGGVFQNMLAEGFPGVAPGMLAQFYNAPAQLAQPGIENVMTPQQYADAQAINQLVGQNAIGVPDHLGNPFAVPQSSGSFEDQAALQALYDTMNADQSMLPHMSPEQQTSWLHDTQALMSYLGMPSPYQGPPVQPVSEPVSPFPNGGTTLTNGTNSTQSGGGRAFR